MDHIEIAGRKIGTGYPPYVIAELSGNHKGSIDRALALIEAAKEAGADAVKLQTYTADTITIDHDGPGFTIEGGPWNGRRLYDLYREACTPWEWHARLFEHARSLGLHCFSSPFDESAVEFLAGLGAPAYKIASFEIIDTPLIECAASTGKPLILSTGMAKAYEIAAAVNAARNAGNSAIALLHCVSGYPTPAEEANCRRIPFLESEYRCPVGLSDHTKGTDVAVVATALGACLIEKHLTLARKDGGPDAEFSLEPDEFSHLVAGVRTAFNALGSVDDKVKPSEQANRALRRSLYVVSDMRKGDLFTSDTVRSIRPGYGLPPSLLSSVLGARAAVDIKRGTPLKTEHIITMDS